MHRTPTSFPQIFVLVPYSAPGPPEKAHPNPKQPSSPEATFGSYPAPLNGPSAQTPLRYIRGHPAPQPSEAVLNPLHRLRSPHQTKPDCPAPLN